MVCYGNKFKQDELGKMKKNLDDVLEIVQNNYSDPKPSIEDL